MIFGGIGLVVVVLIVVMMNQGGSAAAKTDSPPSPADAKQPAAPTPTPVQLAGAKAGKTPARPAPVLTQQTLDEVRALTKAASAFYNEGVQARAAGDNSLARDKQAQAKETLDRLDGMLEAQLLWQEEAQMGGWAMPAEYITLEREYGAAMNLTKKIRMQGGK
jgi:hypothetical protein